MIKPGVFVVAAIVGFIGSVLVDAPGAIIGFAIIIAGGLIAGVLERIAGSNLVPRDIRSMASRD